MLVSCFPIILQTFGFFILDFKTPIFDPSWLKYKIIYLLTFPVLVVSLFVKNINIYFSKNNEVDSRRFYLFCFFSSIKMPLYPRRKKKYFQVIQILFQFRRYLSIKTNINIYILFQRKNIKPFRVKSRFPLICKRFLFLSSFKDIVSRIKRIVHSNIFGGFFISASVRENLCIFNSCYQYNGTYHFKF